MTEHIINKLNNLKIPYKTSGGQYIMCGCLSPTHIDETPSFHINVDTGFGRCFTCGYTVSSNYFVDKEHMSEEELEEIERKQQYAALKAKLKREEVGLTSANLPIFGETLKEYRGLPEDVLRRFGVYVCSRGLYKDRVIFPFYVNKKPLGFTGRTLIDGVNPKYLHSRGFNNKQTLYPYDVLVQENKVRPFSYVVLVEGVLDCLSLWKMGIPSMCNFGVADNLSNYKVSMLLSLGIETIYVSFDKDKAGQKAENTLIENKKCILEDYGLQIESARNLKLLEEYYKVKEGDLNDFF